MRPEAERLRPLKEYPVPNNNESLRQAIGMLSYYSQWIPNFSDKVRPLAVSTTFPINNDALNAFYSLKSEIEKSVVQVIDEDQPFVIETDASDFALGAIESMWGDLLHSFQEL